MPSQKWIHLDVLDSLLDNDELGTKSAQVFGQMAHVERTPSKLQPALAQDLIGGI
jgi:hypothetical protein